MAGAVAGLDVSVVNCNPASALDCFPIMTWEDALAEDARQRAAAPPPAAPAALETEALARLLGARKGTRPVAFDICPPEAGGLREVFQDRLGWTVLRFAPDAERPHALVAAASRPTAAAEEPSPAEADITALAATIGAPRCGRSSWLRTASAPSAWRRCGRCAGATCGRRWALPRPVRRRRRLGRHRGLPLGGGYALYASEWVRRRRRRVASWRGVAPWPMQDERRRAACWPSASTPPLGGAHGLRGGTHGRRTAGRRRPPACGARAAAAPAPEGLTAEWAVLPGAPLARGPLVAEVETDRGLALEFRERLHVVSTRQAIALRPGGEVRVRHVGRLVRPHGNSTARSGFLLLARIFDAGGLLAPPHVVAVQPAGPAWRDDSWVVRMDEVLRRHPGATAMRVSVSFNWVDDKAAESSGDGVSQSLLLEVTDGAPGLAPR